MSESENKSISVAIIDMGFGNLYSVSQACLAVGMEPFFAKTPIEALEADAIILPGVGAFDRAIEKLTQMDLVDLIVNYKKPLLGICLGMQLLFESSEEGDGSKGLGLIEGTVKKFPKLSEPNGEKLRVPHIGWNSVQRGKSEDNGNILKHIEEDSLIYFVHSYYIECPNEDLILSKSSYGGHEFCSSVQKNNFYGCQFHPEKSGALGITIYNEFKNIVSQRKETNGFT